MRTIAHVVSFAIIIVILSSCTSPTASLYDGYYTAEAAEFDSYGWKEYITIYVSNDKIVTVEYNAYNASGLIKSWDMEYMRNMQRASGTYPNEFVRAYAVSLINWQNTQEVDALSGATNSHVSFRILADAAIDNARMGDKRVAKVALPTVD